MKAKLEFCCRWLDDQNCYSVKYVSYTCSSAADVMDRIFRMRHREDLEEILIFTRDGREQHSLCFRRRQDWIPAVAERKIRFTDDDVKDMDSIEAFSVRLWALITERYCGVRYNREWNVQPKHLRKKGK